MILCLALVAGLSVLSFRLIQLQLLDRKTYESKSQHTYQKKEILPALRGMIVDRREEPLAKSIPVCSVYVDKKHLEDPKVAGFGLAYEQASAEPGWADLDPDARRRKVRATRDKLLDTLEPAEITSKHLAYAIGIMSRPLGMRREELRERIEKSKGTWVAIVKDLPQDVAERLREAIDENWVQGVELEGYIKRWYTASNLATHVIGYTGEVEEKDENGKSRFRVAGRFGIEKAMEEYLAGGDGWRQYRRDSYGLLVPGGDGSLKPPKAGFNVKLTLDMGIQAIVEEELDAGLAEFKSKLGTVVLMDPKTGEILAMASRPHFDLNRKENVAENGFNFAIQGVYEPGSTFKIVATSGGVNEGLVSPQTSIFCHNGFYQEGGFSIPDHHPFGVLTVEGILQKSSNIGAYKVARQLGTRRFYDYVERFGFGKKTGILLSGESSGIARNTNNGVDFSRATYGYALNVTPLQMATAYCAVGGNGKLLKPRIIKSLIANDGTVVEDYPPEVVGEVMKPRTAALMRAALEKVVQKGGTATRAAVPGFRVAGKTGTAKKHNPLTRGYYANRYTVSFAGMMPAQDPAFVGIVVIDDPALVNGIAPGGGSVAAPIFQKIAARVAARMNLQPTEPVPPPQAISSIQ